MSARGILVHHPGQWSRRTGVDRVSGSQQVNRDVSDGKNELTLHYGGGLETRSQGKRETRGEMMVILLLSHPILDSPQHELTFHI